MNPYYADDWLTVYGGDARAVLPEIASDSVDCIVTSPPYWGLRDYGTAAWEGGSEDCDHKAPPARRAERPMGAFHGGSDEFLPAAPYKDACGKCGAIRQDSQLGLEPTPEEYVANLVAVFRELRRVLKPSGTCWLNLGDSYSNAGTRQGDRDGIGDNGHRKVGDGYRVRVDGLKNKDLVGIPWRVVFALQADGWYLRSDIIWNKPNPMPESVTDRPTKAHEYLFLLTKSARYYYDADAVREAGTGRETFFPATPQLKRLTEDGSRNDGDSVNLTPATSRNLRSVWTIATRPYPGAHFAVFPPELPERCIKAGSPSGGVVLDPFAGSGTTGMVANRLSRRAILIDLNPEYLKQQMARNAQTPLGLAG